MLRQVKTIEIKIPKEIRQYKESIFFGLSARQFFCSLAALFIAAGIYLGLGRLIGRETASWLCILISVPVAVAGFFTYNGLSFEELIWAFIKSQFLCCNYRKFISENIYYNMLNRKESGDFD